MSKVKSQINFVYGFQSQYFDNFVYIYFYALNSSTLKNFVSDNNGGELEYK